MGLYSDFMDCEWDVPSGYVKIAIENGHRNSEFSHKKEWSSKDMLNYHKVALGKSPFRGSQSSIYLDIAFYLRHLDIHITMVIRYL